MDRQKQENKLCLLRDIYRSIREFEISFQDKYDLCLNEGMTLCTLRQGQMSSSDLAERLGLSSSNMSKVIKSIEDKELVDRILGQEDKRQMYFALSTKGQSKLEAIRAEEMLFDNTLNSIYQTEISIVKT